MARLIGIVALLLVLAGAARCTLDFGAIFAPDSGVRDAAIILQGMRAAPLRPGDAPVDVAPE